MMMWGVMSSDIELTYYGQIVSEFDTATNKYIRLLSLLSSHWHNHKRLYLNPLAHAVTNNYISLLSSHWHNHKCLCLNPLAQLRKKKKGPTCPMLFTTHQSIGTVTNKQSISHSMSPSIAMTPSQYMCPLCLIYNWPTTNNFNLFFFSLFFFFFSFSNAAIHWHSHDR